MVAASPIFSTEFASANACDEAAQPLGAYVARKIREAIASLDRKRFEVITARAGLLPPPPPLPRVPPLDAPRCPGDCTVDTLGRPWPNGEPCAPSDLYDAELHWKAQKHHVEWLAEHVLVGVLDQWFRGDVELWGCGADGAWERVPSKLRNSRFMALYVCKGLLEPAPWKRPPTDLQRYTYSGLEVRPLPAVGAAEVPLSAPELKALADLPEPAPEAGPPRDAAQKRAPNDSIRRTIRAVYRDLAADPPNIRDIRGPVQERLKNTGAAGKRQPHHGCL